MLRSPSFTTCSYNEPTSSYTRIKHFKNALHLAATLKKLLFILLLIGITGKTSGYYHLKMEAVSMMQNAEEKSGKNGEGKSENDYLSYTPSSEVKLPVKRPCSAYVCKSCLSPLLSQPTPPPDFFLV